MRSRRSVWMLLLLGGVSGCRRGSRLAPRWRRRRAARSRGADDAGPDAGPRERGLVGPPPQLFDLTHPAEDGDSEGRQGSMPAPFERVCLLALGRDPPSYAPISTRPRAGLLASIGNERSAWVSGLPLPSPP